MAKKTKAAKPYSSLPPPLTPNKGRSTRQHRRFPWQAILYNISFGFWILLIAVLLVASAFGLGEQIWQGRDSNSRWNLVILAAAYLALAIIAIIHVWSRLLSIKKILRTMPKPYIPTKHIDIPKQVADHITTEYTRTAVIAHISQATTGQQEGWGRPGSKWENVHFRTHIMGTLSEMTKALDTKLSSPTSLESLYTAADNFGDTGALRLFINSYCKIIEKARYGRNEPDEGDAAAADKILGVVRLTLEARKRRESSERKEL